jgi:hypothetical protein
MKKFIKIALLSFSSSLLVVNAYAKPNQISKKTVKTPVKISSVNSKKSVTTKKIVQDTKIAKKEVKKALVEPKNYTSVIIDCSKMQIARAMSPIVRGTSGDEIYPGSAGKFMDMNAVLEGKVVTYENSITKAKVNPIAGAKPLIIKPVSVGGIQNSDPILTRLDSIKLFLANLDEDFLSKRKIIVVYK